MKDQNQVSAVDEKLPMGKNLVFALQHVFVMVAGAVAVPLMVGGAAGVNTTLLISCALFAAGVATLIQTLGVKNFLGAKIPIVEGTSFAAVTTMTGIAAGAARAGNGGDGLREIAGAVMIAGLFCFLLAGIWGKMLKFFPPIVTGTVVTVIGISLFPIGIRWIAGPITLDFVGASMPNIALGGATLIIVLLCSKFLKGILGNLSVLLGIVGGTLIALIHDAVRAGEIASGAIRAMINLEPVKDAALFGIVKPFAFGAPIFKPASVLSLVLVMLVIMTEATGNMIAVHNISGKELDEKNLVRGLRASGISTAFSACFNSYPITTFAQNVGMLGFTNVFSRFVTATAGGILVILAFFPKFAAAFAAIPQPVLGGAGFVMFGMVAVGGIRTLGKVEFNGNKNAIILAVSIGLSLIPTVVPQFFGLFPTDVANVLHSGITIGCVAAILLNLFFNVLFVGKKKES